MKLKYIVLLFWAAVTKNSFSQDAVFGHLKIENGLSQNSVLAIAQDEKGFMWFGTRNGLNRFDGINFVCYGNIPGDSTSLSNNYINILFLDSQKNLWVGTENGLNRFVPEKNAFQHIDIRVSGVKISPIIYSVIEDGQGSIWLSTSSGLYSFANQAPYMAVPVNRKYPALASLLSLPAALLYKAKNGDIWITSNKGLFRVRGLKEKPVVNYYTSDNNNPKSLSDNFIKTIAEDRSGAIWVGTLKGLNRFEKDTETFTRFFASQVKTNSIINDNIRSIAPDHDGNLWVGTQEGISVLDAISLSWRSYQQDAAVPSSLSQNSVHCIFIDRIGSAWIGTFFGGVNFVHKQLANFKSWQHSQDPGSLSNNVVSGILRDRRGNFWISTEGGGLNYFDRSTQKFTPYKNQPGDPLTIGSNLIKTLFIDKDDNLWIGTHGKGLNLYNKTKGIFQHSLYEDNSNILKQSETTVIYEDQEGKLWVGKHPGLDVLNRQGTRLTQSPEYSPSLQSLATRNISSIIEDRNKNIWIGTLTGLYFFDRQTKSLTKIPVTTGGGVDNINCIKEDSKGNIWIGLYYGGLALFDTNKNRFSIYTTGDGLSNNNVVGILEDNQTNLWLSTSNGLVRFNPEKLTFFTYTTSDGLPGNEFNYNSLYYTPEGEMFFGGMNGFVSFYPDKIIKNNIESPLVFTGLKIFNSSIRIDDESGVLKKDMLFTNNLAFTHTQNSFTIEFALLNFIKPEKNRFAYKLEEINQEWIETNTPSATFTNLSPGSYTFSVKGANNDGTWSKPIRMRLTILPPFWKTWWAYALYLFLAAIILFLLTRFFFLRALLKRDNALHQTKLNFFTNISHEIRTHLTLIMAPVDTIERENKDNPSLQQHLNAVKTNADRLLKLVTELMDFRKAESDHLKLYKARHELISFLGKIHASFLDLSLSKNIRISFVHDVNELYVLFDKEQMEKVFYNLLVNAFKFTNDGGQICLNVITNDKTVQVQVIDNGKGIDPEHMNKLFINFFQADDQHTQNSGYGIGLALAKNIIELHGGNIAVESERTFLPGVHNTCFTVTLPLLKDSKLVYAPGMSLNMPPAEEVPSAIQAIPLLPSAENTDIAINTHPYTLLLVEDNIDLRTFIANTLSPFYTILECTDGKTGWEYAIETIPDIIISDVMMPQMDGFVFCDKIKHDERTRHIPVILLTAKSSQADHISGLTKGADIYLTKPFSTQVLELTIRNLLSAREITRKKFSAEFPSQVSRVLPASDDDIFINKLIQIIDQNMDNPDFGVEMLAIKSAMSQTVLYKKVKAITDMSVNDFAKSIRLKKAAQLLTQTKDTVYEIGYMIGFNDRKYFSREFKKQFGINPSEFADRSVDDAKI